MRAFTVCVASFVLVAAAAPAVAKRTDPKTITCDAQYYDYLVGKNLDEARNIGTTNYRVIAQGSARGAPQPKRMTVTVDKRNEIVDVACG